MTPIKAAVCGLLLSTHLVYSGLALADTSAPKARGTITLMDKNKFQCSLIVPTAGGSSTYNFTTDSSPCKNDTARDIEINEIPSATVIVLSDAANCGMQTTDQEFWFKLRTTRKQTTTDYIQLEYLKTYTAGQIISPGLQLVEKWVKAGNTIVRDKLSCVKITASAAPPAPQASSAPAQP